MINGAPYQIEHECPQCGAQVILSENDRLLSCPYCKVRLYLSFQGHQKYYLSSRGGENSTFFVPYWRSKGFEFSIRAGAVQGSAVDKTWNASRLPCFPSSLGIRPQTQRLRLMEPDGHQRILPAQLSFDEQPPEQAVPACTDLDLLQEEEPLLFRTFLRDTSSLIYLPVFERGGTVYDGIDLKALGPAPSQSPDIEGTVGDAAQSGYSFIPALCPNCGNDLAGEKESWIVFCHNCMVGFSVSNGVFGDIPFLMAKNASKTCSFLPFWRISVETDGLPLPKTTGRILPGGRIQQLDRDDFFFWIPAFKVNPALFLRLAHRATTARIEADPLPALPTASAIPPVTVPFSEAVKALKLLLVLLSPRDRELAHRLSDIPIKVKEGVPTLVPFEPTGCELTNRQIQVAVHVNALKYGRNL